MRLWQQSSCRLNVERERILFVVFVLFFVWDLTLSTRKSTQLLGYGTSGTAFRYVSRYQNYRGFYFVPKRRIINHPILSRTNNSRRQFIQTFGTTPDPFELTVSIFNTKCFTLTNSTNKFKYTSNSGPFRWLMTKRDRKLHPGLIIRSPPHLSQLLHEINYVK